MILWIDAQLSPQVARWIEETFAVECHHVRELALLKAEDRKIFEQVREANAVVMTKDDDFVRLVEQNGTPPQIIWITSGNMSNARFRLLFASTFSDAVSLIEKGEAVVEISRRQSG